MFERRLKVFLAVLLLVTIGLALRAAHVQVLQREHWRQQAEDTMTMSRLVETRRGQIVDFRGRVLAVDEPCVDACVDYRALADEPDKLWVRETARRRVRERYGDRYAGLAPKEKTALREQEEARVLELTGTMCARLAEVAGVPAEEVEEARRLVVAKVKMRQRAVAMRNFQKAVDQQEKQEPPPLWQKWLVGSSEGPVEFEKFDEPVAEQKQKHVILRAVTPEVQNELARHIEQYPGLELRTSTHRYYPHREAGCHLLGYLRRVEQQDLLDDPNGGGRDELRQYFPNDLIGRGGVEAMCEQALRGARGRREILAAQNAGEEDQEVTSHDPVPGRDVRLAIDIELQQQIHQAFYAVNVKDPDPEVGLDTVEMYGAAVVIDVPTGQVRALVSHPVFDVNEFDRLYADLWDDNVNRPLFNRATQAVLPPGSTAKPIVGIAAVMEGLVGLHEGIECTGFLELDGHRYRDGKCWTATKFLAKHGEDAVRHHKIPWKKPHAGIHGNPDGHLCLVDGIERSCNVYFENLGHRLGPDGLSKWFRLFGLGRPTGIGIPEKAGDVPDEFKGAARQPSTAWFASIGQGKIGATPLQMANAAATIARGGVWMRPRLLADERDTGFRDDPSERQVPDRMDLGLRPELVREVREGMIKVVESDAGTGTALFREDVTIAAKTGTAQTWPMTVQAKDEQGNLLEDENGKPVLMRLRPSTHANPNPIAPWHRGTGADGTEMHHAWITGFAPAENPTVAFAVLVEYGGSGGQAAAHVTQQLIEACVERGYIARNANLASTKEGGAAAAAADRG